MGTTAALEKWKSVADRLADRMSSRASCADHSHPVTDCPSCDDIAAYEAYEYAKTQPESSRKWATVAKELGDRMRHNAYCSDHRRIVDNCPFCADIAAYDSYLLARTSASGRRRTRR